MKRLIIVLYVLFRVGHHKRRYDRRVARILGQRHGDSYFFREEVRNKTVGNQLGIEAWLVTLTGNPSPAPDLPFLLAGLSTCYDNAVDEERFREWDFLAAVIRGEDPVPTEGPALSAREAFRVLMAALTTAHPRVHERICPHLLSVHEATRQGFELGLEAKPAVARLRDVTYRKGGHSMLAFSLLAVPELSPELRALTFRLGAANQLADDIYDRREDEALGLGTLARFRLLEEEDRRLMLAAASSLPEGDRLLTRALKRAWSIHHREALAFYDSGADTATPFASIGQRVFELVVRLIPPAREAARG